MSYYATTGVFQLRPKCKLVPDAMGYGLPQPLPISEGCVLVACIKVGIDVYNTETLAYIDNNLWGRDDRDEELHSSIRIRLCDKFFTYVTTAKDLADVEYLTECAKKLIKNDVTDWDEMEKYSQN